MIDIGLSISEHGENAWRSRRFNRETKSAEGRISPTTTGDNSAGKVADRANNRKPEDLLKPYIERNSMVKGSGSPLQVCQSLFLGLKGTNCNEGRR